MRTVLFIIALNIHDVARALGSPKVDDPSNILPWIALIFMAMDLVDFFRGKS